MTVREIALVVHFIGLAMGLGTAFGFMFLGVAASRMDKEAGGQFMLKASIIGKMGHIGLLLLLLSGLAMIHPFLASLTSMPLFITKLVLFVVLGGTVGVATSFLKKAAKGNTAEYLKKTAVVGKINLLLSITIVVLAVLVFH